MKFNTTVSQIMKESLLEGNADYGDVMDALKKLSTAVEQFSHIYPADRGTHIHAAYKTEIERMLGRVQQWTSKQNDFVKHKQAGTNVDTSEPVAAVA